MAVLRWSSAEASTYLSRKLSFKNGCINRGDQIVLQFCFCKAGSISFYINGCMEMGSKCWIWNLEEDRKTQGRKSGLKVALLNIIKNLINTHRGR